MDNRNRQEENIGSFFDRVEKKKERSVKARRIISRIIRLIIPPFFPFLFAYIGNIVIYLIPILADDYGVTAILFCALFLAPIYSIIYGISVVRNEKRKYLFALYNPIVSFLYYFSFGIYLWTILAFMWLAFWTLVPVWSHNSMINKLNEKTNSEEAANGHEGVLQNSFTDSNNEQKQEYVKKDYSESFITQKKYTTQFKLSIWKTIRLVIPICFPLVWFFLSTIFRYIVEKLFGLPSESGNLILIFVLFPISCFIYGLSVAKHEERKYFFALYYPVVSVLSMSYLKFGIDIKDKYILPFIAAFFFCTLLPVWIYNARNKPKAKDESGSESDRGM